MSIEGSFSTSDIDSFVDECLTMSQFDHRNVMSLIGVCTDLGPTPYIIMPFMSGGSLLSYLKRERPNLTVADNTDEDTMQGRSRRSGWSGLGRTNFLGIQWA